MQKLRQSARFILLTKIGVFLTKSNLSVLLFFLLVTFLIYFMGLSGGFILDDAENLQTIQRWLSRELTFWGAITLNESGALHRPLSMLTFALNAALTGVQPGPMKLTNIVIHGLCAFLLLVLGRQILRLTNLSMEKLGWSVFLLTLVWLVLPIHVSTVLYVVQRMAQLSALFTLLALIVYMAARARIEQQRGLGLVLLWLVFPVIVVLATLSKENGVLAVLYAAAIEFTLFSRPAVPPRPRSIGLFFMMAIGIPVLVIIGVFIFAPDSILAGYELRDHTLTDRLLTQPRVLLDYVKIIFLPYGPQMGVYHDDFPISVGLTSPPSTWLAILTWITAIAYAIWVRKTKSLQALGVFFFLAGHAMESTFLPLEIYFEHRNYLPSYGLLLFVFGFFVETKILLKLHLRPQLLFILILSLMASYGFATAMRSLVWGSPEALLVQALEQQPNSFRVRWQAVAYYMQQNNFLEAVKQVDIADRFAPDTEKSTIILSKIFVYCRAGISVPGDFLDELERHVTERIPVYAARLYVGIAKDIETKECPGLTKSRFNNIMRAWVDQILQPQTEQTVLFVRYYLARLLASEGRYAEAITQAQRVWIDGAYNAEFGVLLYQLQMTVENPKEAAKVLAEFKQHLDPNDLNAVAVVDKFEKHLRSIGYWP